MALIQSLKPGMLVRLGEEREPPPELGPNEWSIPPRISLPAAGHDSYETFSYPAIALLVKRVNKGTYRWQALIDEKPVYLENKEITSILKLV